MTQTLTSSSLHSFHSFPPSNESHLASQLRNCRTGAVRVPWRILVARVAAWPKLLDPGREKLVRITDHSILLGKGRFEVAHTAVPEPRPAAPGHTSPPESPRPTTSQSQTLLQVPYPAQLKYKQPLAGGFVSKVGFLGAIT